MSVTLGLETTLGKVADLRAFAPKGSLESSMGAEEWKGVGSFGTQQAEKMPPGLLKISLCSKLSFSGIESGEFYGVHSLTITDRLPNTKASTLNLLIFNKKRLRNYW